VERREDLQAMYRLDCEEEYPIISRNFGMMMGGNDRISPKKV
jgi:hypothetical protein